jgi:type II protein arginine methyltransferase
MITRLGYHIESLDYFRKSLVLNPDFLKAQENLDNACGKVVERWHFRMVNDVARNTAYQQAIDVAVQQLEGINGSERYQVLDIGTGTGLLR